MSDRLRMMQQMARKAEDGKGKIPVKAMGAISPHADLLYAGDGWSEYLPSGNRQALKIASRIGLFGRGIEDHARYLPPSYARGSIKRQFKPMAEVIKFGSWIEWKFQRIRFVGIYDQHYAIIKDLAEQGFMVPTLWRDPPRYLKARYGRPLVDRHGRVIYDVWEHPTRAFRNPEVMEMKDYSIKQEFDPFPPGYQPKKWEREERVLRFLELYVETGHMIAAAKAVGVTYYQLLLWANESEELQAQVAMAEHAVRMHVRSNATTMAINGDKQMITLLMREQMEERKLGKKQKIEAPEVSDETEAAISLAQKAIEAFNRPATGVSHELPPQPPEEVEEVHVAGNRDSGRGEGVGADAPVYDAAPVWPGGS